MGFVRANLLMVIIILVAAWFYRAQIRSAVMGAT